MKTTRVLGILLVAQLALALFTWWPADRSAQIARPLLALDATTITGIEIARKPVEGSEAGGLKLRRTEAGWTIDSSNGYPADAVKVEQLITQLLDLRVRAPIATRPSSHNALSVGERDYGRRVKLSAGGTERELIVGADRSNSIRVRFADEDDVYLADGISEFALADTASAYWSREFVRVPIEEIRSFTVENERGTLRVERSADGWTVADAPADTRADSEAIEKFLAEVTALTLVTPLGTEVLPEYGLGAGPRISWTLEASDQSVVDGYAVGVIEGGQAIVKSDSDRFVVQVEAANVARLGSVVAADFVRPGDSRPGERVEPGAE